MHHHLIAIPDTGYANVVGILDAGDTLRACLESKVDLVLCGHKHRPWLWNLGSLKLHMPEPLVHGVTGEYSKYIQYYRH